MAVTWLWLFARAFGAVVAEPNRLAVFLTAWELFGCRFGDCVSTPAARDIGPTTILSRHAIRIVLISLLMVTDSRDFACAGKLSASLAW